MTGAVPPWGNAELVLVAQRQRSFSLVERQPVPPGQRPRASVVPTGSVETATLRRRNDADDVLATVLIDTEPVATPR